MKPLADGLFQLPGFPPNAINIYLSDDVLIDAGTRFAKGRILRHLKGRPVAALALTHGHPDHQGSSRAVCDALHVPLWCGEGDADAVESGKLLATMRDSIASRISARLCGGPACPVARRLREGDEVGGFTVIETPGHSPGHISFWRGTDRTLILGDVLFNMGLFTGLREPPRGFTPDPARNRESARKLAALEPVLVCFGHGPPLRDTRKFVEFVAKLA